MSKTDPEPTKSFDKIDKLITEHKTEYEERTIFSWCDNEPFPFYMLITGFEDSKKHGYELIEGHAKGIQEIEGEEHKGPFPFNEWVEVRLPIPGELRNWLYLFAKQMKKEEYQEFKDQLMFIHYNGIDWIDDPHRGKTRAYIFYVEMIDDEGNRILLDESLIT